MSKEEEKKTIQEGYRMYRKSCNRDTALCLAFIKQLNEYGKLEYLAEMEDLTTIERLYIQELIP